MPGLSTHYGRLQTGITLSEDATFRALVVPNGNEMTAIHRWFHLKESFSADLLSAVLSRVGLDRQSGLSLVDPYAGVATSLVSALQDVEKGVPRFNRVLGVERNPFLHLVATTKVRSLVNPAPDLVGFGEEVSELYRRRDTAPAPRPALSTFANPHYFPQAALRELLRLKSAIYAADGDEPARDIALVCLAACVEPVSNLRRDGRALRYEERKSRPEPVSEFNRRLKAAADDLAGSRRVDANARVVLGDGRNIAVPMQKQDYFDLALFSPPYPNNIDYTEVYKLENWFLDLIGSSAEFREQRLRTIRSHPSVAFEETYPLSDNGFREDVAELLGPLLAAIPIDRYRHGRRRLVNGYFEDMLQTLKGIYELLCSGGRAVYVVGNSVHGHGPTSFVVASDVVMAHLAKLVGFTVEEIIVARFPSRRNIPSANAPAGFLRESVVLLRK
jgi:hypothetical protein